jgi:hypothetical protein
MAIVTGRATRARVTGTVATALAPTQRSATAAGARHPRPVRGGGGGGGGDAMICTKNEWCLRTPDLFRSHLLCSNLSFW